MNLKCCTCSRFCALPENPVCLTLTWKTRGVSSVKGPSSEQTAARLACCPMLTMHHGNGEIALVPTGFACMPEVQHDGFPEVIMQPSIRGLSEARTMRFCSSRGFCGWLSLHEEVQVNALACSPFGEARLLRVASGNLMSR